jgi:TldD protein
MPTEPPPHPSLLARLDAALLRRIAAALVDRPGDYGDLFVEELRRVEIRRDTPGPGPVLAGGGAGAAVRIIGPGGIRHHAGGGLDPARIAALPGWLKGDMPGGNDRAWMSGADQEVGLPGRTSIDALARYMDDIESALLAIPSLASAGRGADVGERGAARPVIRARAELRQHQVAIATSEGDVVEDRRDWTAFTLRVSAPGRGGRALQAAAGGGARDPARLAALHPPGAIATSISRAIEEADAAAPAPSGEVPVILGPGTGGLLFHEACGHALEGDRALRGRSAIASLLGDRIGPETLTLVDDPTIDGLPGSRRFDDEGWPSAPTVLIDAGRVAGLLLDRATALRAGTAPTGSARRESYRDLPLPRMTNTFVREGPFAPDEILAAVPRGLYIAELGAGQVDTASADFTFHVRRGYLVAGGRVVAPAGACLVSGNGVRALAGVRMIGSDLRFDPGSGECGKEGQKARAAVGQPTLLIEGLVVRPGGA